LGQTVDGDDWKPGKLFGWVSAEELLWDGEENRCNLLSRENEAVKDLEFLWMNRPMNLMNMSEAVELMLDETSIDLTRLALFSHREGAFESYQLQTMRILDEYVNRGEYFLYSVPEKLQLMYLASLEPTSRQTEVFFPSYFFVILSLVFNINILSPYIHTFQHIILNLIIVM
jgi:hypothetical protein